ncbi:DegT/DnrJ/EryC1/StrS family aminotransferase [Flavobacterium silvaticum]|uniref:DegT/DnrJ/EryC1/StrS family aminotransferase n=1 Tax=Flavobacterium silvaticum TaxID=1852020 RepID=A0A972FJ68_9FLAO|nr:DegT/DnrJ/EryC1/StrS family aminotransferase [Flavobacterium silvaticum]NMH26657.1 DegT/DnrJ/EryC1/StrS family aminotransferase [Flavobacterium silvaticum]
MIPFNDLKKSNDRFRDAFAGKLQSVLDSGQTILGNEVSLFEKSYANYCGTSYCLGVANGLDALILIFKGYMELGKLKSGDEVIVPANTYIASILAVSHAGLVPVPVEPDALTCNIDPVEVKKAITPKTRAVLAVHLYGRLALMDELDAICKQNNLLLIEDAAQSHGAQTVFGGHVKKAGNLSDAAGFSFYPTKNLGAIGDAGAITTNDESLFNVLVKLRNYGTEKKYIHDFKGINSRLDELQAAFLNVKLPFLDSDNKRREEIATLYRSGIKNPTIRVPDFGATGENAFHLFVVFCKERQSLMQHLSDNGVQSMVHYPVAPHRQVAYSEWSGFSFPITEKIHDEILSLPISAVLSTEAVEKVIRTLNEFA